jgi:hypothetical protein
MCPEEIEQLAERIAAKHTPEIRNEPNKDLDLER